MDANTDTVNRREQLILSCEDQVKFLARKMASKFPGRLYNEILSVAWIGTIKAVDNYDPKKGKLSTYVAHKVRGAVIDYLREVDPLTRHQRKAVKHGGPDVLYVELDTGLEDRRQEFSGRVMASVIVNKLLLETALTDQERSVILQTDCSFKELAVKLHVHPSRVSRINNQAIRKMREVAFR